MLQSMGRRESDTTEQLNSSNSRLPGDPDAYRPHFGDLLLMEQSDL